MYTESCNVHHRFHHLSLSIQPSTQCRRPATSLLPLLLLLPSPTFPLLSLPLQEGFPGGHVKSFVLPTRIFVPLAQFAALKLKTDDREIRLSAVIARRAPFRLFLENILNIAFLRKHKKAITFFFNCGFDFVIKNRHKQKT